MKHVDRICLYNAIQFYVSLTAYLTMSHNEAIPNSILTRTSPRTCIDWRIPDCLKHTHVTVIPPKFNSLPLKIYDWKTRCLASKTYVFLEKRCCYNDTQVYQLCVCVSTYHLSLMLLIMEVWNIPPWNSWTHCSLLVSRRLRYLQEIHHIKRPHKWVRCWFQTFSIFHPKPLGTDSHVHMNGSTRLKHQDAGPPFIQSVSKAWKMPEKSPKGAWWQGLQRW